jgi:hypothetical protein
MTLGRPPKDSRAQVDRALLPLVGCEVVALAPGMVRLGQAR